MTDYVVKFLDNDYDECICLAIIATSITEAYQKGLKHLEDYPYKEFVPDEVFVYDYNTRNCLMFEEIG